MLDSLPSANTCYLGSSLRTLSRCVGEIIVVSFFCAISCSSQYVLIEQRITMPEIKRHDWFLKNLPADLMHENDPGYQYDDPNCPPQSIEEIMRTLQEARVPGVVQHAGGPQGGYDDEEREEDEMDNDMDDFEGSGEYVNSL